LDDALNKLGGSMDGFEEEMARLRELDREPSVVTERVVIHERVVEAAPPPLEAAPPSFEAAPLPLEAAPPTKENEEVTLEDIIGNEGDPPPTLAALAAPAPTPLLEKRAEVSTVKQEQERTQAAPAVVETKVEQAKAKPARPVRAKPAPQLEVKAEQPRVEQPREEKLMKKTDPYRRRVMADRMAQFQNLIIPVVIQNRVKIEFAEKDLERLMREQEKTGDSKYTPR
jgi:hypothetical protein